MCTIKVLINLSFRTLQRPNTCNRFVPQIAEWEWYFRVKTVFDNLSNFYHGRYLYLLISERKLTQIYFHVNEKLVIWMLDKIVLYIFPKSKLIVWLLKKKGKIMTFLLHINGRKLTFYLVITVIMLGSLKDIF